MTMAAGGAERDRRARRLTKEAIIAAGRCLRRDICQDKCHVECEREAYVDAKNVSLNRKNLARYLTCITSLSIRMYS